MFVIEMSEVIFIFEDYLTLKYNSTITLKFQI